jgi:hypothetical protein
MKIFRRFILSATLFFGLIGAANAQFVRANLNTANTANTPCGVLPATAVIAAGAGFNTCAYDMEFANNPTLWAIANWLDVNNTNTALPFSCGGPGNANTRCAACFTIGTDPLTSTSALLVKYLLSYGTGYSNSCLAYSWHSTSHYLDFPNYLIETTIRLDASTNNQAGYYNFVDLPYAVGNNYTVGTTPLQRENDHDELSWSMSGGSGTQTAGQGSIQWPSGPTYFTIFNAGGFHVNSYVTLVALITSNGTSGTSHCGWFAGTFKGCVSIAADYLQRNVLVFLSSNTSASGANTTAYVASVRILTCAAGAVLAPGTAPTAGTMCNGPNLHSSGAYPALNFYGP